MVGAGCRSERPARWILGLGQGGGGGRWKVPLFPTPDPSLMVRLVGRLFSNLFFFLNTFLLSGLVSIGMIKTIDVPFLSFSSHVKH
jgi:hypothetical protein